MAQTIRAAGLDQFYRRCDVPGGPPPALAGADDGAHADAAPPACRARASSRRRPVRDLAAARRHPTAQPASGSVETYLQRQPGVAERERQFRNAPRARALGCGRRSVAADLLRAIAAIGYRAYPYDPARREALARREEPARSSRAPRIALLAMMQVMMFAMPAYISVDGVEPEYQRLLELGEPRADAAGDAVFGGAVLSGRWRDLRLRRLGMDVPVALGIGGAFIASAWATISGAGAVYYDSVTMFVALLLVARLCRAAGPAEGRATRSRPSRAICRRRPSACPAIPVRRDAEAVAATALGRATIVLRCGGRAIPADGEVVEGRSSVEEALLTGESWPQAKAPGEIVLAGSINRESPLLVRVSAAGEATTPAALARLVERAASDRPRFARLADRVGAWFVARAAAARGGDGAGVVAARPDRARWRSPSRCWSCQLPVRAVARDPGRARGGRRCAWRAGRSSRCAAMRWRRCRASPMSSSTRPAR